MCSSPKKNVVLNFPFSSLRDIFSLLHASQKATGVEQQLLRRIRISHLAGNEVGTHSHLPTYPCTYLPMHLPVHLPAYPYTYLPTYLHIHLPTYPYTYLPNHTLTYISIYQTNYPTTYLNDISNIVPF